MARDARRCDEHGFYEGETCPTCGSTGRFVVRGDRRTRLSKFLSATLRHAPHDAGLALDDRGWTAFEDVVDAAEQRYRWADEACVAAVVALDPKGRFERDDERMRAAYGHSVDVSLERRDATVPEALYHGTRSGALDAIRREGLRPMSRQLVHLSGSRETAAEVGRRHASDPVVLRVDASAMLADGYRITKRGADTYTTECVPPTYLES